MVGWLECLFSNHKTWVQLSTGLIYQEDDLLGKSIPACGNVRKSFKTKLIINPSLVSVTGLTELFDSH